jgi:hypothetical protein
MKLDATREGGNMSDWRYVLKQAPGGNRAARLNVINRIIGMIRAMRRTLELPIIRYNARLPGQTFYLGLAVRDENCTNETVPDYVEQLFERLGMRLNQYERGMWPQRADEIESFLQGVSEYGDLTTPLRFEPGGLTLVQRSLSDTDEIAVLENPAAYDRLLWWCSSKGRGSVTQLSEVADKLGLNEKEGSIWSIIKKLALLGHLDVFQKRDRDWVWQIAPLTIVESDTDQGAFLCGAQSGLLRQLVIEKFGAKVASTNGGPSLVSLSIDCLSELKSAIGYEPRRAAGAAARWAELLPTIDDWQANLVADPDIATQPHQYSFEHYSGNGFHPVSGQVNSAGFYRVRRNGEQFRSKHVFRNAEGRWLNGDFASLRFLSLSLNGQTPQARVFADGTLVAPCGQRWPTLYERALVLASGKLPSIQSPAGGKDRLFAYCAVPKQAAEQLASKLGVNLTS